MRWSRYENKEHLRKALKSVFISEYDDLFIKLDWGVIFYRSYKWWDVDMLTNQETLRGLSWPRPKEILYHNRSVEFLSKVIRATK